MHASDPVNRIMSAPVLTIGPEESIKEMLRMFMAYPIHHLPVVEQRRVIGMLSSSDVMKLEFFLPPPGKARDALLAQRWHIRNVMRSPVITVTEHETVQHAAKLMTVNGIHSVPVVDSEAELIGIVTTTDIMQCCLNPPPDVTTPQVEETRHFPLAEARVAAALLSARRSVNTNHDPAHVAATLLATQRRVRSLEEVAKAAKRYLSAGQDERLHAALSKAIERADRLDEEMGSAAMPALGISG